MSLNDFMKRSMWLIYGSSFGGAIGALLIYLNAVLPSGNGMMLDLPMGFMLSVALGMVGGLLGGVIGSFVSGVVAKESLAMNIGQSLGIGVVNGFITGTMVGIILGFVHKWKPDIITPAFLGICLGVVVIMAIIVYYIEKK